MDKTSWTYRCRGQNNDAGHGKSFQNLLCQLYCMFKSRKFSLLTHFIKKNGQDFLDIQYAVDETTYLLYFNKK